jgi:thiosulfate/3-mercaptopyruvate sulfurtransferase
VNDTNLLIDCEELHSELPNSEVRIIDCRFELLDPEAGRRLYSEAHIPGAVFADLDLDLAAPVTAGSGRHPLPGVTELAMTFGRLGITNSTRVVVYDQQNGALAARCWWLLRWLGHQDARLLNGGFNRWQQLGLDTEEGAVPVPVEVFRPKPQARLVLLSDEIVNAGDKRASLQLVDARDTDRFAGISEPIDPVAGHIPGSISVPFTDNLAADGTWKSRAELRKLWDSALGQGAGQPWSVMCGSGVTACHHVISGLLAGLPEPRVYVGSWSEWITDPDRPISPDPV